MHYLRLTAVLAIPAATLVGLITTATTPVTAQAPPCSSIRQRKEITTLSFNELVAFFRAVQRIQSGPHPNDYDWFAITHPKVGGTAHGFPLFLPWHRAFVREFERRLQTVDPSVMVPYWDWTIDSQAPELSPVFHPTWFGGNGQNDNQCVNDGQFQFWQPSTNSAHCLRRRFDNGNQLNAFFTRESINLIAQRARQYEDFRGPLEVPAHSNVHVSVGGDMGQLISPNDPLFFIHHAFVDKIWADFQATSPQSIQSYSGRNADGSPARVTDQLEFLNLRVQDVLRTESLCYTYAPTIDGRGPNFRPFVLPLPTRPSNIVRRAEMDSEDRTESAKDQTDTNVTVVASVRSAPNNNQAPAVTDRTELVAIRVPKPIPEDYLTQNNYNVAQVRKDEAMFRKAIEEANTHQNYVSPSALLEHPILLREIVKSTRNLSATHGDRQLVVSVPQNKPISDAWFSALASRVKSALFSDTSNTPKKVES